MSTNMYLYTLFALFSRFRQSMVDTLCLHNNTSNESIAYGVRVADFAN